MVNNLVSRPSMFGMVFPSVFLLSELGDPPVATHQATACPMVHSIVVAGTPA